MSNLMPLRTLCLLLGSSWLWSCAHGSELDAADLASSQPDGSGGATGGQASVVPAGGGALAAGGGPSGGGSGGASGSAGAGLSSGVFGSTGGVPGAGGGVTSACDNSTAPSCDWTRVDGCCAEWACERASGADVFNTYPVESCRALVECVKAHPGCSSASDPLCFQNENPSAPCLQQGYQASHTDPDGPFAWTAELVACVCGYQR